jgi:hypothetical protein
MVVKWGHYTRFAGYGITRTIEVHDPAMNGSPGWMIAGSVTCNAVLRWRIDTDNVVLKMH